MAGGDGGSSSSAGRKRKRGDDDGAGTSGTSPPPSPPSPPVKKSRSIKCPVDGCRRRRPDHKTLFRHMNDKHTEEQRRGVKYPSIFTDEETLKIDEARRRTFPELYGAAAPVTAEVVAAAVEAGMLAAEAAHVVAEAAQLPEEDAKEAAEERMEIPDLNLTPSPPSEDI